MSPRPVVKVTDSIEEIPSLHSSKSSESDDDAAISSSAVLEKVSAIEHATQDPLKIRQPSPHFRFLDLPPELEDAIYKLLIQSGHLSILRVSKRVHARASHFIESHGSCILSIRPNPMNLDLYAGMPVISNRVARVARSLRVHIELVCTAKAQDRLCAANVCCQVFDEAVAKLATTGTRKNDCQVVVEVKSNCYHDGKNRRLLEVLIAVGSLSNFAHLSFKYIPPEDLDDGIGGLISAEEQDLLWRCMRYMLKPALGRAVFVDKDNGLLEFDPMIYVDQGRGFPPCNYTTYRWIMWESAVYRWYYY